LDDEERTRLRGSCCSASICSDPICFQLSAKTEILCRPFPSVRILSKRSLSLDWSLALIRLLRSSANLGCQATFSFHSAVIYGNPLLTDLEGTESRRKTSHSSRLSGQSSAICWFSRFWLWSLGNGIVVCRRLGGKVTVSALLPRLDPLADRYLSTSSVL